MVKKIRKPKKVKKFSKKARAKVIAVIKKKVTKKKKKLLIGASIKPVKIPKGFKIVDKTGKTVTRKRLQSAQPGRFETKKQQLKGIPTKQGDIIFTKRPLTPRQARLIGGRKLLRTNRRR